MAYYEKLNTGMDEELSYCYLKIASIKKDKKFEKMFALDLQNRKAVLELLEKQLVGNEIQEENKNGLLLKESHSENYHSREISFLEMLILLNGSIENILNYIEAKIIEARFPYNIFQTIKKTKKGANQKGLNSDLARQLDETIRKINSSNASLQIDMNNPRSQAFWFGMGKWGLALIIATTIVTFFYAYHLNKEDKDRKMPELFKWYAEYYQVSQRASKKEVINFLKKYPMPH